MILQDRETVALAAELPIPEEFETLNLTFTGDLMAHTVNYKMKDYNRIYDDVRFLLQADDLSFTNFETPVAPSVSMSTYPCFNVHLPYVKAAVDAGFDVFSLANNHSWDQGDSGIAETLSSFRSIDAIYFSGLKDNHGQEIQPVIINKNGWTILFVAVTEILNFPPSRAGKINYLAPDARSREKFLKKLESFRNEHPCDVFIVSLHTLEPEYVTEVSPEKIEWFDQIAASGVDIIWAHHPHVLQSWTLSAGVRKAQGAPVLFMYSLGNFISGQRYRPELSNPGGIREYTGDGVLLQVTLSRLKNSTGYSKIEVVPIPVTNYTDPRYGAPVVRLFNERFFSDLSAPWVTYYRKRFDLLQSYLPLLPSIDVPVILE